MTCAQDTSIETVLRNSGLGILQFSSVFAFFTNQFVGVFDWHWRFEYEVQRVLVDLAADFQRKAQK